MLAERFGAPCRRTAGVAAKAREPAPVAAVMMWRGCIAPYDSNNKITTSFTCDYDGEDASSASFRFLHSPTRVKNFLPDLLLENRSLLVDHLGALLHHRVGSPDLLAVVETLK